MKEIPSKVAEAYARLKSKYPFFIALKHINGKYYVYSQTTTSDRKTKKIRSISNYLGRINENGAFIKKRASDLDDIKNAREIIEALGGKVVMPETLKEDIEELYMQKIDPIDRTILTALTMNSMESTASIGTKVGMKASSVHYRIRRLEEKYFIKYTVELDTEKLGYNAYIAFVKFNGSSPSKEIISEALRNRARVQFAAFIKGQYDLMIYFLAEDNSKVANLIYDIRVNSGLKMFPSYWQVTSLKEYYGFMPLRNEFFELLKERVWHREKEFIRKKSWQITESEYAVMKDLNMGIRNLNEINKRNELKSQSSRYAYMKLRDTETIKRPTILMQNIPLKYNAVLIATLTDSNAFIQTRKGLLGHIIKEIDGSITNKYSLEGDTDSPDGAIFISSLLKENDLDMIKKDFNESIKGMELEDMIITDTIIGSLGHRLFDNKYSNQYNAILKYGEHNINYTLSRH
ncbi:MAG: AsnC family transcriptional regulator [Candidatus Marsarchaeota archaeon]|nr:AsnC family transcriptional regulator [Candidatus Marsarchaeota archaeon]